MQTKQIADIVNAMASEYVGETALVAEDLRGIVEIGKTVSDAMGYEQFVNSLVDRIGRVIMVSREYDSSAPDIMRRGTGIPYGSITEKIRVKLPPATVNDSWAIGQTWTPGEGWTDANKPTNDDVSPFITVRPEVESTFYNGNATYEIDMTFPTIQMRSAFTSPAEWRRFVDTVEARIFQSKTVFKDALTMRTINNLIGEKLYAGNAVIDLITLYNATHSTPVTVATALTNKEFLRYASYIMMLYPRRLRKMSRLYNTAGYDTFTPTDRLRFVTLDMFSSSIETFMQSDTFHDNLVGLKTSYANVDAWQGGGNTNGIDFDTAASLKIKTASGHDIDTTTGNDHTRIVGVMFDVEAAWQEYDNPRTTSQYNPRKEQTTFFYKEDVRYANDLAENCVVFAISDASNSRTTKSK